jgi:hypothetical protein
VKKDKKTSKISFLTLSGGIDSPLTLNIIYYLSLQKTPPRVMRKSRCGSRSLPGGFFSGRISMKADLVRNTVLSSAQKRISCRHV